MEHLGVDLNFSILQSAGYQRLQDAASYPSKVNSKTSKTKQYKTLVIIEIIYLVDQPTSKFTH